MTEELGEPEVLSGSAQGRWRWGLVAAVVVAAAVGAAVMHQVDDHRQSVGVPAGVGVRVSLGAHAGDITVVDGDPVVSVPLVIANEGGEPLTLTDIRVDGPGATLVLDPDLRPRLPLPTTLSPGLPLNARIAIRSSCRESLRPVPVVTLTLVDGSGQAHEVPADVPGLSAVWGQTLAPISCQSPAP